MTNCTISFAPDAHDSADAAYRGLVGLIAEVTPRAGEPFMAEIGPGYFDDHDGQYRVAFYPYADGRTDRAMGTELDVYNEVERIEVT